MKTFDNDFFREATLQICGSLSIGESVFMTLNHLKQFIPVDRIFLELFDDGLNSMRTIAAATAKEGNETDLLTPLSKEAKTLLNHSRQSISKNIEIFNDPHENLLAREMLQFHNVKATSLLIVPINPGEERLGGLVFISESQAEFTEYHSHLISLLKEPFTIAVSNALEHREVLKMKMVLSENNRFLQNELKKENDADIIGADFGLKNVMDMVRQVAPLESPVFLNGETGTGKEIIASAIHNLSGRREGPFIRVNCGGIPLSLIDSELFGHEKGAFTGAVDQKIGRFERADQGTIFLDEIGEFPLDAQVKLLRVLQEKEIDRVGGKDSIKLDIRVIAATHRNLKAMINEGTFREDLYFRLQIFPIEIPPLRERSGDIPALVQYFVLKKAREMKLSAVPDLAPNSMNTLMTYRWPGNVRELENAVERALILSQGSTLTFPDLLSARIEPTEHPPADIGLPTMNLNAVISKHISSVLKIAKGKVEGQGGAAELLGVNPGTLRNRMRKLGIQFGRRSN